MPVRGVLPESGRQATAPASGADGYKLQQCDSPGATAASPAHLSDGPMPPPLNPAGPLKEPTHINSGSVIHREQRLPTRHTQATALAAPTLPGGTPKEAHESNNALPDTESTGAADISRAVTLQARLHRPPP